VDEPGSTTALTNVHEHGNLLRDLASRQVDGRRKPVVFQFNKRDLPQIVTMDWVRENFRAERCA
jgi:hypothetical protein